MTRRRRTALRIAGGLAGIVLLLAGYIRYEIWATDGCVCGLAEREPWTVHNPFRNREPERIATLYLESLRNSSCRALPDAMFTSPAAKVQACGEKERLASWELRARHTDRWGTYLAYGVWRGPEGENYDSLGLALVRVASGWQIANMDTFY